MFKKILNIFSKEKTNKKDNKQFEKIEPKIIEPIQENKVIDVVEECNRLKKIGNDFLNKNDFKQAEQSYREIIKLDNTNIDGHMNLGWVLSEQSKLIEAEKELLKVIELKNNHFDALYVLAKIYEAQKKTVKSIEYFNKILKIKPEFEDNYVDLSNILLDSGQYEEVKKIANEGLKINDNNPLLNFNLGTALFKTKDYEGALNKYKKAISLGLENQLIYFNLGLTYYELGFLEESIESYNKAKNIKEDTVRDSVLNATSFINYYKIDHTLEKALKESEDFNKFIQSKIMPYTYWINKTSSKIKIGFVSGDFNNHPVSFFLLGIIKNLDKNKFELYAYQTGKTEDNMTQELKKYFIKWTKVFTIKDIDKVYSDNIDILIDLAGHTGENGLLIFAKKPAPKQITWLGYFGTTGLDTIDYIIADRNCLNDNEQKYFTEKIKYLPETRLSLTPPDINIEITKEIPFIKNNYITFGCYQNLLKINKEVLTVWKEILNSIPNSIIKIQTQQFKNNLSKIAFLKKLEDANINKERIVLVNPTNRLDYLDSYNDIDILLDTFPYTGGTTTCESLWMGVPTITLKGNNMISRQGASMLSAVELNDWITNNENEYIQKAIDKSKSLEELIFLRKNLREKFISCSLGNPKIFTKDFENVLIEIFNEK